jgi:sigma-54 dependent transcriptional regulator, acetoin dehydrogenase operon transcriptional activator AcoR
MTMPTQLTPRRGRDATKRPVAAALSLGKVHEEVIDESHERCAHIGLSRIESADFAPLGRPDLNEVRERNQRLYTHAAPVMEMLFEQIVNTQSMVLLTDACGTILHSIGDDDFLAKASKVALQPGVNWAESSKGTNAIGTALIDERPIVVYADEHFLHANQFLSCQASPILDARGNILGVLDVTGDHRRFHEHTMGLVKMSARMIENHWLSDDFSKVMRLHLHSRVEFIGTLMEGILAVARDGRIVGANRSALDHVGLSSAAVRMHSVTSLLGTSVAMLVDHFRSPLAAPLALHLPNGALCHVRARFNWATWYGLGEAAPVAGPATTEAPAAETATRPTANAGAGAAGATTTGAASASTGNTAAIGASGLRQLDTGDAQVSAVIAKVRRVIDRDITILLLGDTGTGKELLARAIHHDSQRARQPFVAVNCASIPEPLIEAELFGYEDGAFTGARRKGAVGKILQADGGTLFLDEIGDMPLALQARLLRALQERSITPLGSSKSLRVDVAVIGATHRNLRDMIEAGTFREDLYYRLNGLVVKLPPLRQRTDLPTLARSILRECCPERTPVLSSEVARFFQAYGWPGNVRQLANVLRTAAVMADGAATITRDHLSDDFIEDAERSLASAGLTPLHEPLASAVVLPTVAMHAVAADPMATAPAALEAPVHATLEAVEIAAIRRALDAAGGNISEASKSLGVSRNTIYRKLRWNAANKG